MGIVLGVYKIVNNVGNVLGGECLCVTDVDDLSCCFLISRDVREQLDDLGFTILRFYAGDSVGHNVLSH